MKPKTAEAKGKSMNPEDVGVAAKAFHDDADLVLGALALGGGLARLADQLDRLAGRRGLGLFMLSP